MTGYFGSTLISGVRVGSQVIDRIYMGANLLWSGTDQRDGFDRDDGDLGSLWQSMASNGSYEATIVNGTVRIRIPDGLIALSLQTARHLYIGATAEQDNGWLEFQVATKGDNNSAIYTQVFDWMAADTTGASGVGVELRSSNLYITRRVAGVDTQMASCGSYLPGDVIRLVTNENNYSLYRQGQFVGQWSDDGQTAVRGLAYRNRGLVVRGWKDLLGPRRFSAAIDYIDHS